VIDHEQDGSSHSGLRLGRVGYAVAPAAGWMFWLTWKVFSGS